MIAFVACAEVGPGSERRAPSGGLSPLHDRLLEDEQIFGDGGVSVEQVQAFLAGKGSALASYSEGGSSAARLIVDGSRALGVSPVYMLARLQSESGLVQSGSLSNLDAAAGCGCPDEGGCDPSLSGFGRQVDCAARLIRSYFDDMNARGETISGWAVGRTRQTLDGCSVTPENRATAALYTYTPWVGAYAEGCGDPKVGGSSLVAALYHEYAAQIVATPPI